MKGKLKIRADAGAEIGYGHIMRCISLAHMLKNDFEIHFYSMNLPENLHKEIESESWKIYEIDEEEDFLSTLNDNEIVVIDGYHFDSDYQKEIKKKGSILVCIDDFHAQHFYADLVINHAPGITEDQYEGEPYTKYLLGPGYALLRPEFLESNGIKSRKNRNEIKHLFICFGGSDAKNLTCNILEWLPVENFEVTVVVGSAYTHIDELNEVINKRNDLRIKVKRSLTAKEIRKEMIQADLGIVPSSGILFEVLSTKLPVITGFYTENQKDVYEGFVKMGSVIGSDEFQKKKLQDILTKVSYKNTTTNFQSQHDIIDNNSQYRIRQVFLKYGISKN